MNKIIKTYFDKSHFLTIKNKVYAKTCEDLFDFQIKNDLIENDITSKIITGKYKDIKAVVIAKQSGIVAGIEEVVYLIQKRTSLRIKTILKDGTKIKGKELIMEIVGNPLEILSFERIILNILARMSGIATQTANLIKKNSLKTFLASTRKTLWGIIDKKAVTVGGGLTHRLSLSDGILIKDNHIDIMAKKLGLTRLKILEKILILIKNSQINRPFEIEVETEKEAYFLNSNYQKNNITTPLIMMLDNFKSNVAAKTIKTIRKNKCASQIIFELSGGINENNIKDFDKAGAHILSLGILTHSAKSLNISLQLIK